MGFEQYIILAIFFAVFGFILTERLEKTTVTLAATVILLLSHLVDFQAAILSIDFNTICLLLGMMVVVECLREVRVFEWLSIQMGLHTQGNPFLIFLLFGIGTAILSAFLDNVTTVLVMVPLVLSLSESIGVPGRPFLLALIFLSNVGGTWTLIGDPPNILIGAQVPSLTFTAFMVYLAAPVFLSTGLTLLFLKFRYKDTIRGPGTDVGKRFLSHLLLERLARQRDELSVSPRILYAALAVFGVILLGFFSHSITHLEAPVVAIGGATLMLLVFRNKLEVHHVLARVEWSTLLFFAGLFVLVGAMEHAGWLDLLSHTIVGLTENGFVLILLVLVSSAVASGVIDNIPFVAVMIPVIKDVIQQPAFSVDGKIHLIWWALALGACFGGNASPIGASANVVSLAIARQRGVVISFKEFLRDSIPVTAICIAVSACYLAVLYYLM